MEDLIKLVTGSAFTSAFGLAPATVTTMSLIGQIVPGVLDLFGLDNPATQTLLNCPCDFDLRQTSLGDGYYVILAAHGENDDWPPRPKHRI